MKTRIYAVIPNDGTRGRLIRATTPAQAARHAIRTTCTVRSATQDDVADLLIAGAKIEVAADTIDDDTNEGGE